MNCPDDNGGFYVAGITSWGIVNIVDGVPLCNILYPSVYTAVGKYLGWIADHSRVGTS